MSQYTQLLTSDSSCLILATVAYNFADQFCTFISSCLITIGSSHACANSSPKISLASLFVLEAPLPLPKLVPTSTQSKLPDVGVQTLFGFTSVKILCWSMPSYLGVLPINRSVRLLSSLFSSSSLLHFFKLLPSLGSSYFFSLSFYFQIFFFIQCAYFIKNVFWGFVDVLQPSTELLFDYPFVL